MSTVVQNVLRHEYQYTIRKIQEPNPRFFYEIGKRIFEIFSSLIASIFLIIPFVLIAIMIKRDSKGPVFYKQERLGKNSKPFMLYKFRSMRTDAERDGAKWASANDDRCTKVGQVLRKYHLDELPQIPFNILPGTLSIVGPRPERRVFYDEFATYIDGFDQRLYIKPGLTGLAQVNGGYELAPQEKIIHDLEYIEHRSAWLDIKILFKTVAIVFNHDGAR